MQAMQGIVLAGGQSRRMGVDKATMDFGGEPMLHRIVRVLAEVLNPIVVVAAENQHLQGLPSDVLLTHDRVSGRGPLEGLAVGLSYCADLGAPAAFVTTCDAPLIHAAFVQQLADWFDAKTMDALVPQDATRRYPLSAIYRTSTRTTIEDCVRAKRFKVVDMLDLISTIYIDTEKLRFADPELLSLRNVNSQDEYIAAMKLL